LAPHPVLYPPSSALRLPSTALRSQFFHMFRHALHPLHHAPCKIRLTSSQQRFIISFMVDKYFYKREKVANLLFDLVKYLLTALGATLLFTDKEIPTGIILIIAALAILVFAIGIFITPRKEA